MDWDPNNYPDPDKSCDFSNQGHHHWEEVIRNNLHKCKTQTFPIASYSEWEKIYVYLSSHLLGVSRRFEKQILTSGQRKLILMKNKFMKVVSLIAGTEKDR